jgi:hypothetical protein
MKKRSSKKRSLKKKSKKRSIKKMYGGEDDSTEETM